LKKKVLITGINGFLGSHLAKHLMRDFEIIGLEYSIKNLYRIEKYNFKVYSNIKDNLQSIFIENEIYAVIHLATLYRRSNEPIIDLIKTNINLPIHLLELSNRYKVTLFLNTDSFFNNEKFSYSYLSDYTLSKKQSLEWLKFLSKSSNCKVINMKIYHMFGKNDSSSKFIPFLIEKIKTNTPFLDLTPGLQTRDFIYVKDVITAFECVLKYSLLEEDFQEFHVGTGKSHRIKDLACLIKEITSSKTKLIFGALPYREGEIMESNLESFGLTKIGWKPKFSLENALIDMIYN
jgi:nucleoside-diphosphate-sugar epimerase